jgi:hypothetical protein
VQAIISALTVIPLYLLTLQVFGIAAWRWLPVR